MGTMILSRTIRYQYVWVGASFMVYSNLSGFHLDFTVLVPSSRFDVC